MSRSDKKLRFRLECSVCGCRVVRASKKDFDEMGILFFHAAYQENKDHPDVNGDHSVEPVVIDITDGSRNVWMVSFIPGPVKGPP